jgi:hypothetical protein
MKSRTIRWIGATLVILTCAAPLLAADTTPPVLTLPADFFAEAAGLTSSVGYVVSAVDAVDGPVPVVCTPPPNSLFPLGPTTVSCSARDAAGNVASGSFKITLVDTTPPVLHVPGNVTTPPDSPSGATLSFIVSASDAIDGPVPVTCTPPSGSLFPVGATTVTCSATDHAGNSDSRSFRVTVAVPDTTPPVLTIPTGITAIAIGVTGTIVSFAATALDASDGVVPVTCTPPSGTLFAPGNTTVTCSASDAAGNVATRSFIVGVALPADTMAPVLTVPSGITITAPNGSGASVSYAATAIDDHDPTVPVVCVPPSGTLFGIQVTTVTCTARDLAGNVTTKSFTVTVLAPPSDTTPPVITTPGTITAEAKSASGARVTYTVTARDNVDGTVGVTCTPASGTLFKIGTTSVSCSASDSKGNRATATFLVKVVDRTAPSVSCIRVDPTRLCANGNLKTVQISVTARDLVDGSPNAHIRSVTSSDPAPRGNSGPDYQITGPLTVKLRASTSNSHRDRTYTITIDVVDNAGNSATSVVTVLVKNDCGGCDDHGDEGDDDHDDHDGHH